MRSTFYQEIQPERDVSGDNFTRGNINFNWTMDSSGYFNPHRSYFRIRVKLTASDGTTPLAKSANIGPNMFIGDCLFQAMRMNLNNKIISEISDYVPQVSALKQRMYKSEEELNNYENSTNMAQALHLERVNEVSSDGTLTNEVSTENSRRISEWEIIWRPCLGFWDIDAFIPATQGLWNMEFTPQPENQLQRFSIETSFGVDSAPGSAHKFVIDSMHLYIMKGIGEPCINKTLNLQYKEIRMQSQNLTTASLHQKTFQVHPNTQELTLAYQAVGASISNTGLSASKFLAGTQASQNEEILLNRFWLRFGGKQLPTPIPDPEKTSTRDRFVQRYVESIKYTNALKSPEPLRKWFLRGPYYHFSGYGEHEKEDRVYVSQSFSSGFAAAPPNCCLFDHYLKRIKIHIKDSILKEVEVSR